MRLVAAIVLVDLPILLAVAIVGWFYGYADTYNTVMDYRMEHLWTFVPSLVVVFFLVRRWRRT